MHCKNLNLFLEYACADDEESEDQVDEEGNDSDEALHSGYVSDEDHINRTTEDIEDQSEDASSQEEVICNDSQQDPSSIGRKRRRAQYYSSDEDELIGVFKRERQPRECTKRNRPYIPSSDVENEELAYGGQHVNLMTRRSSRLMNKTYTVFSGRTAQASPHIRRSRYSLRDRASHQRTGDGYHHFWSSPELEEPQKLDPSQQNEGTVTDSPREDIGFDQIAGVDEFLLQLKEMIILPLIYPELFTKLGIVPPRGVLFHGPPGTGKTLLARILASTSSKLAGKPVSFFHRNGSECLSKWIGEAEQNLAKLFKQAQKQAPSIIFFDEIDGMAPDRSGNGRAPDQSHVSLVSMLLSLMDGLDDRGSVIVIGATNRIDAIDPALRRPGRFDKEFYFNLPDEQARKSILEICTRTISGVTEELLAKLAKETEGYSGAELKGLCTEASLMALRRSCPSIYGLTEKIEIHMDGLEVSEEDFRRSFNPKRHVNVNYADGLPPALESLCAPVINAVVERISAGTRTSREHSRWRSGSSVIMNPIINLSVLEDEEHGIYRRLVMNVARKVYTMPSNIVILDPATLLKDGLAYSDSLLLSRYRPMALLDKLLICFDLESVINLTSQQAFELWMAEWKTTETARLLLLDASDHIPEGFKYQNHPIDFSLVPEDFRSKFIKEITGPDCGVDLSDMLGVAESQCLTVNSLMDAILLYYKHCFI